LTPTVPAQELPSDSRRRGGPCRFPTAFLFSVPLLHSPPVAPAPFWGALEPGPYRVGFRTLHERDATRSWEVVAPDGTKRDLGRPIRISVWYPAPASVTTPAMHYGDYFRHQGPPEFEELDAALDERDKQSWIGDLTELTSAGRNIAVRLFATPVAARLDAAVAPGRFPVLLYAGGRRSRADANVELAEYLASHGYVVVTVPQLGPSADALELGSSPADLSLLTQDLAFAGSKVRALPFADLSRLAVAGHSAGGVAALQLAMLDPSVKAVLGLDASYGMRGEGPANAPQRNLSASFPDFAPEKVRASLLDLRRAPGVQAAVLDSSVVSALESSDRYVAVLPRMYHGDFTEFAPIAFELNLPWHVKADGRTRATGYEGNQRVYRAVLAFLDAELRGAVDRLGAMTAELRRVEGAVLEHQPPRPRTKD
jgi:hypothetical protein